MIIKNVWPEEVIQDYRNCVLRIENNEIRKLVDDYIDSIDDSPFWIQPGSPSGRYHPPENNLECGLIIHCVKAFYVAEGLFKFYGVEYALDKDVVRAAVLLHDTMKGFPLWKHTVPDHGTIAASHLGTIPTELPENVVEDIKACIRTHMSRWSPWKVLAEATTPTKLQRITQMADYIASRKDISFYPLKNTLGEKTILGDDK